MNKPNVKKTQAPLRGPTSAPKTAPAPFTPSFGNPLDEEKDLVSWKAAERPHKVRGREFYSTSGAFVILLSIISLFFREFLLMLTIWAFAFVTYVMSKTPPGDTVHAITTRGIKTGQRKFFWGELFRFWFDTRWGKTVLFIDTLRAFPRRLMFIVPDASKEKIKSILVTRIPYDKPEETAVERATRWLQEKVPLEEESKSRATPTSAPTSK